MATVVPLHPESENLPEPQTRGYFLNLMRNLSAARLRHEMELVAEAGFNVVVFPVYNNGWTLFPCQAARSHRMPILNPLFRKWNPLGIVIEEARARGLAVWAFARPYNFHPRYSLAEHRLLKKNVHWQLRSHPTVQSAATRRHEQWNACPVNRDYRRYLGDLMCEMIAGYPIDAIMLNATDLSLRGGPLEMSPYCYCESCRTIYAQDHNGASLVQDASSEMLVRVRAWQMEKLQGNLDYLRHRIMRSRRTLRLLCRVEAPWRDRLGPGEPPNENAILVDWRGMLEDGKFEALAVDHGGEDGTAMLGARLAADYADLGDEGLFMPVVSISALNQIPAMLETLQRYPVPGFIAEFQSSFSREEAALIHEQHFARGAPPAESEPVRSALYLLDRVRLGHQDIPVLHDLAVDIMRLLTRQMPLPEDFDLLQVIEENLRGLELAARRNRMGMGQVSERTLRDLGLARRFVRMACLDVRS